MTVGFRMRPLAAAFVLSLLSHASAESLPAIQIVSKCIKVTRRADHMRSAYTYRFRDEVRNLDGSGRITARHSKVIEIIYFAGKRYEHLVEKDGKKLNPDEQRREDRKMSEAAAAAGKLSEPQKAERLQKIDREREHDSEFLELIPAAYDLTLKPEIFLNSRRTYVISATPKPGYKGKYAKPFSKMKGTLFIDEQDFTLARLEAEVLDKISIGLFLARLSEGTRVTFEQLRVNNEVWLPKSVSVHADARALVKTYRFDEDLKFSDYRKFQSESHIVSSGAPAGSK